MTLNTISTILILCLLSFLGGCFNITRSNGPDLECNQASLYRGEEYQLFSVTGETRQLQTEKIRLFNWNSYKGKIDGWLSDFSALSNQYDLVLLQEAYLSNDLLDFLRETDWNWDISTTFKYKKIQTGVLTASRVSPNLHCSFQMLEPWLRTPKAVLISRYDLSGTDEKLVVANVHLINFTFDIWAFKGQLDRLKSILTKHKGPMIVAGDFNTWSDKRLDFVLKLMEELRMQPVIFTEDERSEVLGNKVDHIFYRKLEVSMAKGIDTKTSDHNPMLVEFTFETVPVLH